LSVLVLVGWCTGPATAAGVEATWGAVKQLGGVSTVTVGVPSSAAPTMTCWSDGNCVAVGTYLDHIDRSRVFVQDEVNGTWKPARSAKGTDAQAGGAVVSAVSCGGPGDCVGIGGIGGASFIEEEVSGVWQPMRGVPGLSASIASELLFVDCPAPASCTAAGQYESSSGIEETFTTSETGGTWSTYKLMDGSAALGVSPSGAFAAATPDAISCSGANSCAVGGYVSDDSSDTAGYIYGEVGGVWEPASLETSTTPVGQNYQFSGVVSTVSCPAAGSCMAGGYYQDANGTQQALLVTQSGSTWGEEEVPGTASLNVTGGIAFAGGITLGAALTSISCVSAGNCTAIGYYGDATAVEQGFVANESSGTWSLAAPLPGLAALNAGASHYNSGSTPSAVSCPTAGNCSIVGVYTDAKGRIQYFTAGEVTGTPGDATRLPGTSTFPVQQSGPYAPTTLSDLWCGSGGDCLVVGALPQYYISSTTPIAFTAVETASTWEPAAPYAATATVTVGTAATVTATQCPAPGECVALGQYQTASRDSLTFVAQEVHGAWRADTELTSLKALGNVDAYVDYLSCPAVGACTVGGTYYARMGSAHSFYDVEVAGVWRPAETIRGLRVYRSSSYASVGVQLTGLTCTGVGNCVGIGQYQATATTTKPFLLTETSKRWSVRAALPGLSALHASSAGLSVLSCVSTGYCLAGGEYTDRHRRNQSLMIAETKGIWTPATTVPRTVSLNVGPIQDGGGYVSTAACATWGNCIETGEYVNKGGNDVPYLASEHAGKWAPAVTLPDIGRLLGKAASYGVSGISFTSAACPSPASCIVVGLVPVALSAITRHTSIFDDTFESFSILESNGSYSKLKKLVVRPPNAASVASFQAIGLACESASQCVAAGDVSTIEPLLENGQYQFENLNGVSSASESVNGSGAVSPIHGLSRSSADTMTCRRGAGCAVAGNEINNAGEVPFVVTTS
jgi:hypothetical protein